MGGEKLNQKERFIQAVISNIQGHQKRYKYSNEVSLTGTLASGVRWEDSGGGLIAEYNRTGKRLTYFYADKEGGQFFFGQDLERILQAVGESV